LQQAGVGEEVTGFADRYSGLTRARDLRLGRDAVAERQFDARAQHPRPPVVGIGLNRIQQLDPRGAHVARLERGQPALIGRAARRTGGQEEEKADD
jgi:hypothetical protein